MLKKLLLICMALLSFSSQAALTSDTGTVTKIWTSGNYLLFQISDMSNATNGFSCRLDWYYVSSSSVTNQIKELVMQAKLNNLSVTVKTEGCVAHNAHTSVLGTKNITLN